MMKPMILTALCFLSVCAFANNGCDGKKTVAVKEASHCSSKLVASADKAIQPVEAKMSAAKSSNCSYATKVKAEAQPVVAKVAGSCDSSKVTPVMAKVSEALEGKAACASKAQPVMAKVAGSCDSSKAKSVVAKVAGSCDSSKAKPVMAKVAGSCDSSKAQPVMAKVAGSCDSSKAKPVMAKVAGSCDSSKATPVMAKVKDAVAGEKAQCSSKGEPVMTKMAKAADSSETKVEATPVLASKNEE